MKRRDEVLVGVTLVAALAVIVVGALWLSEAALGRAGETHTARFRTVGGLGVGDPVVLRGVRVGRVAAIRLGERNWVEAQLQIYKDVTLPQHPAIIAASASLFGEWQAGIINYDQPVDDPNVERALQEASQVGGGAWPGATLPDIGQLTAQAGRIAGDIASVSSRIQTAFDSTAVTQLQQSIRDFGGVANKINRFTEQQTKLLHGVGTHLEQGSDVLAHAAVSLQNSLARVDSATNEGQLVRILANTESTSVNLRRASDNFQQLMSVAHDNQATLVSVLQAADTVMTRIANRNGTLGRLVGDTTLYVEATNAVVQLRQLLADIQANPRRYFKFSVF